MSVIKTRSGKWIDVLNPDPEAIDIHDIAWALAGEVRFGGHCDPRYSVAQHSVELTKLVPQEYQKTALLHDASEAYLRDIPAPIKRLPGFLGYRDIEARLMRVIAGKYDIRWPLPEVVHTEDQRLMEWEAYTFRGGKIPKSEPIFLWAWPPHLAYSEFLKSYGVLA